MLGLAAAGERGEGDFGDLCVGDPVALVGCVPSQVACGYLIGAQASSPMLAFAVTTLGVTLAVTRNHALARIAMPTNARP
jgi:hypothetical protein